MIGVKNGRNAPLTVDILTLSMVSQKDFSSSAVFLFLLVFESPTMIVKIGFKLRFATTIVAFGRVAALY